MNLTEFKNGIAKKLGLSEDSSQDAVWAAFCEKWDAVQADKEDAVAKLEQYKQEHKISEQSDADIEKAALEGMKLTGNNTIFVGKDLRTYQLETYCRENSKGFYYKAEKVGDKVKLTKIQ